MVRVPAVERLILRPRREIGSVIHDARTIGRPRGIAERPRRGDADLDELVARGFEITAGFVERARAALARRRTLSITRCCLACAGAPDSAKAPPSMITSFCRSWMIMAQRDGSSRNWPSAATAGELVMNSRTPSSGALITSCGPAAIR